MALGYNIKSDSKEVTEPSDTTSDSPPMDSPWPMYCHDVRHTGRSPYSTASNTGTVKWKFQTDNFGIDSSPAIDENGTIYIGSNEGYLHAINSNGTEKWRFNCNDWVASSAAIAEDGTIYVGSEDHHFYAINPNGTLKWKFPAGGLVESSPTIAEDGTIYFGVVGPGWDKGRVYALNPNGTVKWHYDTGDYVFSSPSVGDNGIIYITSNDRNLYAFYFNGTLKWKFKMGDWLGSPTIADDGTIYVASWDGYLYAIFPNGTMKWKSGIGWGSGKTPSIAEDGTVYIGEDDLYAIYPNGTRKWTFDLGTFFDIDSFSQAISSDGTIYVGVSNDTGAGGYIIAINPDGTEKWRERIHNERVWSSPAIGSDGTVYIGTSWNDFGVLHAFGQLDPNAPEAPTIIGSTEGKIKTEYEYNFTTTDPNGDDVYYYIEWGDGAVENWIGPYSSGEEVKVNHSWDKRGTYTISARAKDTDNLWGPWSELETSIPRNKATTNSLFYWFLERFPILNRLLLLINS